ncbi:MAG: hypothetical protein FWE20_01990 [Defluviitaleaceae bacterium]|nr:hypothetical protein [Defluviitaleaceae bacterium]
MRIDGCVVQEFWRTKNRNSLANPDGSFDEQPAATPDQGVIGRFFIHNSGVHLESDRPLVERTLRSFRLTDRDRVQIIVISPSQRRGILRNTGSFIHRPTTSSRSKRIEARISRWEREIQKLETGITEDRAGNS